MQMFESKTPRPQNNTLPNDNFDPMQHIPLQHSARRDHMSNRHMSHSRCYVRQTLLREEGLDRARLGEEVQAVE